jgi:nucleotide-binding universal stress UspA family protein
MGQAEQRRGDMYDTILVPLDGSERAERILPYVEELACRREATVIFLQVVEPAIDMVGVHDVPPYIDVKKTNRMVTGAESYLAALTGEMRAKGLAAKAVVECGSVVATILDVAEREKVDLIAMASHGRTGLARVFYGSVAAGIMQQVNKPLLLIRSADSS